jgi:hypothetical protein
MRRTTTILAVILTVGLAMAPTAAAHHAGDESDANAVGEYYLTVEDDGITVWEETNGHDGLQTSQTSYEPGDDGCLYEHEQERGQPCTVPSDTEVEL